MTHWDGLTSANSLGEQQRICILGATNRIQDIDEAILRRLPKKFPISLPTAPQRRSIFSLTLRNTKLSPDDFDLDLLVKLSKGMSGSDIKEACRDAAMVPVREFFRDAKAKGMSIKTVRPEKMRGLRTDDFFGRSGGASQLRSPPDVDEEVGEWEDDRASPVTVSENGDEAKEVVETKA